jgi:serine/threonine protein kinase
LSAVPSPAPLAGRFRLLRTLGEGAQGTVHLADDLRLEREVAIKMLHVGDDDPARLLDEARAASRLSHPNVVALYDADEDAGRPYLVFEYVAGRTLSETLKAGGRLAPGRAANLATQLLRGLAAAHRHGILHRDVKPGNVMLTAEGLARIMDFGIALRPGAGDVHGLCGTPAYMAPECISGKPFDVRSDLYAAGVVLYEMLVGQPPSTGPSAFAVMNRTVNEPPPPPSAANPGVDEHLDAVVLKALSRDPGERYPDAEAMIGALERYLDPEPAADATPAAAATLEFLIRRMRHRSDFPALTNTVQSINRLAASDREHSGALTSSILKDVALTTKLLKMVNAACFKQFGASVSTVSRAVAILGFGGVRNVALSLMLFEHLQNRNVAGAFRDELVACYFGGVAARGLAAKLGIRGGEEAFICAMFHRLGKLLVAFYLNDEAQAIARLVEGRELAEDRAAREVLGLTYEQVGIGIARHWKLPQPIIDAMEPLAAGTLSRTAFEQHRMRSLAALANGLADVARASDAVARRAGLDALIKRFTPAAGVDERMLAAVAEEATREVAGEAPHLGFDASRSDFLAGARRWAKETATASELADTLARTVVAADDSGVEVVAAGAPASAEQRNAILAAGIQDITNTLVGDFALTEVLEIILETMYRGIGFTRTLIFVRDPRAGALRARAGFGADADALVKRGLAIPLGAARDLFYASVVQGADVCIDDIADARIRPHVPAWYREAVQPRGVVLLPVSLAKRVVALLYADTAEPGRMQLDAASFALLKTLRNQAALALKTSLPGDR